MFPAPHGLLTEDHGGWNSPARDASVAWQRNTRDDLKTALRQFALFVCSAALVLPAAAQTPTPASQDTPPALLQIEREELRPGKGAAHAVNEGAWAAAYAKAQSPVYWLGMTSVTGPSEAWFLTRQDSFAAFEKDDTSTETNPALLAERDRIAAIDGDLLSRTSTIIASYRPALSYQPVTRLANMRYMTVNMMRVKAGHVANFTDGWRMIVDAHKKANMDEHWAVYQVESGMADTTFLFLYAHKSLAELDTSGPMHAAAGYRDAVGDGGRRQMDKAYQDGIEMTQTLHFRLRPGMSTLPKDWAEADAYWARPAVTPAVATVAVKKK
jgi:hypothetical protein